MHENMGSISRRQWLKKSACGFGSLAFAGLCAKESLAAQKNPLAPKAPMFAARAKSVIFIFMQGGPSHVDSFDYKPQLIKQDGKEIDFTGVRFGTFGKISKRRLMKPLWKFARYGECGQPVSELFRIPTADRTDSRMRSSFNRDRSFREMMRSTYSFFRHG